jgi:hypothetical protein
MNRRQYLLKPIRLAVLSVIGLTQVILVTLGCVWIDEHFGESYPLLKHLRIGGAGIGFLTLFYPLYILMAMESPKQRASQSKNGTTSNQ